MKKFAFTLFTLTLLQAIAFGADIIKKSSSGVCHDKKSAWYDKTKKFKSYKTMKECLDSGGRLPKQKK